MGFNSRTKMIKSAVTAICACALLSVAVCGCGGGGGARQAASQTANYQLITPGPWFPPSLDERVRTTAIFKNVTYYLPSLGSWLLFEGTAGYPWISAIGTTSGLSASMSNPFKEVGVMLLPLGSYRNPGTVEFYIDGNLSGALSLSSIEAMDGYKSDRVFYYKIASGLTETTHTVTMVIATGTVGFDGWRMTYHNQVYNIDCSDANTQEYDTISETERLRDAIESYAQQSNSYPDTSDFSNLVDYMSTSGTVISPSLQNPYTNTSMANSAEFSAGDYYYTSSATSTYDLVAYGGRGTLVEYTPDSAKTLNLELTLTSPPDHFATTSPYVDFTGTTLDNGTDDWGAANLSVCCGLSGETNIPASGTFNIRIYLKEGVNNINVVLSDPFGQKITLTRTITKDTTSPNITLIEPFPLVGPVGAQYYNSRTTPILVKASVEKNSSAILNGVAVPVDSLGVFQSYVDLIPGDNIISIVASDAFDNTNVMNVRVVYTP